MIRRSGRLIHAGRLLDLECFRLNTHELPAQMRDGLVEPRRRRRGDIVERTRGPRREMALEERLLPRQFGRERAVGEPAHDLEQQPEMVLRIEIAGSTLDSEAAEILAQLRQRSLVQETGQVE